MATTEDMSSAVKENSSMKQNLVMELVELKSCSKKRKDARSPLHPYIPSYLYNAKETVVCKICGDKASGYHYSIMTCEGCKAFFRRAVQCDAQYICHKNQNCEINTETRTHCSFCRFKKCKDVGMSPKMVLSDRERVEKQKKIAENKEKKKSDSCTMTKTVKFTSEELSFLTDIKAAYIFACTLNPDDNVEYDNTAHGFIQVSFFNGIWRSCKFITSIRLFQKLKRVDLSSLMQRHLMEVIYMRAILYFSTDLISPYVHLLQPTNLLQMIEPIRNLSYRFKLLQLNENELMLLPLIFIMNSQTTSFNEGDMTSLDEFRDFLMHLLPRRWFQQHQQSLLKEVIQLSQNHDVMVASLTPSECNLGMIQLVLQNIFDWKPVN